MNKGGRHQSSNFLNRASLIKGDNDGKSSSELSFNLDRGTDVNLNLAGNMDAKNLLLLYKQKFILL